MKHSDLPVIELQQPEVFMSKIDKELVINEIAKVYKLFVKFYFKERDPDSLKKLFSENISNIGSASDELATGLADVMDIFYRDRDQCPDEINYKESNFSITAINSHSGLAICEYDLYTIIDKMPIAMPGYRISMIVGKSNGKWLINHLHFSKGEEELQEGESFPLKEIEKRNKILEQIVQDRTKDLSNLNEELKQANKNILEIKQRFESVFENVNDGIMVADWTNKSFYMLNNKMCDLLGYSKNELLNLWIDDILPKEYYKESIEKLQKQYAGKTIIAEELPFLTKNNEIKYFDVNSKTVTINDKQYFVSLLRDITEKRATMELHKEMEISRKASETKDLFLANISHEIRTPVTGIIGMTEVLKRSELNNEQYEYLEIIKESSNVLLDIINDLLDISKIEAGKLVLREEAFTLHELLWNIKTLFEGRACRKSLDLKLSYSTNIQDKIIADKTRIEQILMNLLTNAIKYTEEGSVEISVSALSNNIYNSEIKIEVKDTGIGISDEDKPKLFKKFEQLDQSYTRKTGGSGLGLYICKELTKLLGGKIDVESTPDVGSNFWFTFKVKKAYTEEAELQQADLNIDNVDLGFNVLIVDDKEVNIQVIKLMLESAGCNVDIATDGKEAIAAYKPDFHQIIFMDIMMPVMDGVTSMLKIKEKYKNAPPIVALTANAMEGDAQTYMSKGFSDYMPKPANRAGLVNMMLKWVK